MIASVFNGASFLGFADPVGPGTCKRCKQPREEGYDVSIVGRAPLEQAPLYLEVDVHTAEFSTSAQ